jgi:hypothetical protein
MEPETSTPKIGPEHGPSEYQVNPERVGQLPTPEQGIENGAERREQTAELQAAASDASSSSPILPSPVVLVDQPITVTTTTATGPTVAADEDLIEKEWVDKAKKIVAETQNDPYQREEAVNQLQRDYLKKRYGREMGEAS